MKNYENIDIMKNYENIDIMKEIKVIDSIMNDWKKSYNCNYCTKSVFQEEFDYWDNQFQNLAKFIEY